MFLIYPQCRHPEVLKALFHGTTKSDGLSPGARMELTDALYFFLTRGQACSLFSSSFLWRRRYTTFRFEKCVFLLD